MDSRLRKPDPWSHLWSQAVRGTISALMVAGVAGAGFSGSERNASVDVWLPYGAFSPLFGDPLE